MKTQIRKNWYISSKVINVREKLPDPDLIWDKRVTQAPTLFLAEHQVFSPTQKNKNKNTHLELNIIDKGVWLVSGLVVLLTSERRA